MTPEQLQIFVDTVDVLVVCLQQFSKDIADVVSFLGGMFCCQAMTRGWNRRGWSRAD